MMLTGTNLKVRFTTVSRLAVGFSLLIAFLTEVNAAAITAKSLAYVDVAAAIALASDGDTVIIPAGNATWSKQLLTTKCLTLAGAGSGNTLITTSYSGGSTAPEKGAIRFSVSKDLPFGLRGMAITHTSVGTQTLWVEGGTGGTPSSSLPGISTQWRMTDVNLTNKDFTQSLFKNVVGVNDHCTIVTENAFVYVEHPAWNGGANGHGSWSSPVNWGGPDFLFYEDCNITYSGSSGVKYGSDAYEGGRFVVRYCTLNNAGFTSHGTETHSARGTRAGECYNNTFKNGSGTLNEWRSGTLIAHDNICTGYSQGWALRNHRNFLIKDLGAVTGVNLFDQNMALDSGGNPLGGNIAPDAATGTVSSLAVGTITDKTKGWTANQWRTNIATDPSQNAGYVYQLVNTSDPTCAPAPILDNTATSITYHLWVGTGDQNPLTFKAGQTFAIRKVYAALDQPGKGLTDAMNGYPPQPAFWPHQQLDPCYSWNNWNGTALGNGIQLDFHVEQGQLKEGRDFYNRTEKPNYKPYVYPHPLVSGQPFPTPTPPATPGAPQNLQIAPRS